MGDQLDVFFPNTPFNNNLRAYDPTNNAGKMVSLPALSSTKLRMNQNLLYLDNNNKKSKNFGYWNFFG